MLRLGPLILRNVLRNRRRTILTLASTAVSLALLALLVALYQGFFYGEEASPSEALRLICRHRVSLTNPLPASYQARIKSVPGVEEVSAWSWFAGKWKEPKNFFARFAVDADVIFNIRKDLEMPAEQLAAFKRERTACAISKKICDQYDIKLGDRLIIVGDIYPVTLELTCVGIFNHPATTSSSSSIASISPSCFQRRPRPRFGGHLRDSCQHPRQRSPHRPRHRHHVR